VTAMADNPVYMYSSVKEHWFAQQFYLSSNWNNKCNSSRHVSGRDCYQRFLFRDQITDMLHR